MKILLSNDDGYEAPGLGVLHDVVSQFAEVIVMAPEEDKSGVSNSLTLRKALRVMHDARGFGYVNGTPADCVHLALMVRWTSSRIWWYLESIKGPTLAMM